MGIDVSRVIPTGYVDWGCPPRPKLFGSKGLRRISSSSLPNTFYENSLTENSLAVTGWPTLADRLSWYSYAVRLYANHAGAYRSPAPRAGRTCTGMTLDSRRLVELSRDPG